MWSCGLNFERGYKSSCRLSHLPQFIAWVHVCWASVPSGLYRGTQLYNSNIPRIYEHGATWQLRYKHGEDFLLKVQIKSKWLESGVMSKGSYVSELNKWSPSYYPSGLLCRSLAIGNLSDLLQYIQAVPQKNRQQNILDEALGTGLHDGAKFTSPKE